MHQFTDMRARTHIHTRTQRFAALCSVVGIPSWAILTFEGSRRVGAFTFAVTAAVVIRALVHVLSAQVFVSVCSCEC